MAAETSLRLLRCKNKWVCFDPSLYHAVKEVRSGTRRNFALFTPKIWKRLTPQNADELCELGFSPPTSPQDAEASAPLPVPSSLPSLTVVLDKTQGSECLCLDWLLTIKPFLAQEPVLEYTARLHIRYDIPPIASKTRT